jgi:hypothetical protein
MAPKNKIISVPLNKMTFTQVTEDPAFLKCLRWIQFTKTNEDGSHAVLPLYSDILVAKNCFSCSKEVWMQVLAWIVEKYSRLTEDRDNVEKIPLSRSSFKGDFQETRRWHLTLTFFGMYIFNKFIETGEGNVPIKNSPKTVEEWQLYLFSIRTAQIVEINNHWREVRICTCYISFLPTLTFTFTPILNLNSIHSVTPNIILSHLSFFTICVVNHPRHKSRIGQE